MNTVYVENGTIYCTDCATSRDEYNEENFCVNGEADTPRHCDSCKVFLENPLTNEGLNYVCATISEFFSGANKNPEVLDEWYSFYCGDMDENHYHAIVECGLNWAQP